MSQALEPGRLGGLRWLVLLGVLAAGCASGGGSDQRLEQDPLLPGPALPRGGAEAPAGTAAAPAAPAPGEVPPLPPTHTATSTAALAGGEGPSYGYPLRMRDEPALGGRSAVRLEGPRPLNRAGPPPPIPLPTVGAVAPAAPAAPVAAAPVRPAGLVGEGAPYSYEQLQEMLRQRGVTRQQLRNTGVRDEWQFICSVPDRQKANFYNTTEATAAGGGGTVAMWAAIQKIDSGQK
jgi:hypothetical protein